MSTFTAVRSLAAPARGLSNSLFTAVVTLAVVVCVVPIATAIGASGGREVVVLAVLMAAVPVGPLVWGLLWLDRYDPEPRQYLAAALLWGAVVATLASLRLGGIGQVVLSTSLSFPVVVVTPFVEELTKGLFLHLLLWWRRSRIDSIVDGMVYAGLVGLGFAFVENVLYLVAAYDHGGGDGAGGYRAITGTFIVRCLASPFAHPMFTVCTGIGAALAVVARRRWVRGWAPLIGFVVAVVAHSLWNRSALTGNLVLTWAVLMVPAAVGLVAVGMWIARQERLLLWTALMDAVEDGLYPFEHLDWVITLRARHRFRQTARFSGGLEAERAMRLYQSLAVELGFLCHRMAEGSAPAGARRQRLVLAHRLERLRPRLACIDEEAVMVQ